MIPYHAKTKNQVVNLLSTDATTGITIREAEYRLKKHGKNVITHEKRISKLKIFLNQFRNPLIYILLGAIIISLAIQHIIDAAVIAGMVLSRIKSREGHRTTKKNLSPNCKGPKK